MARDRDPDADFTGDNEPVDVGAVRRDDALIDSIAAGGVVPTDTHEQYELALLLTDWRNSIVSEPLPAGPSLDEALAAVERSRPSARLRLLRPIAGAAAAVAVALGGATILSYDAEPGDPLWAVKSVVFSSQADSTMAKMDARSQLEQAERLIAEGNGAAARSMLATAAERATGVRDSGQRDELEDWRGRLAAELETTDPEPSTTAPGTTPDDPATPDQGGAPPEVAPDVEGDPGAELPGPDSGTVDPTTTTTPNPGIMRAPVDPTTTTTTSPTSARPSTTTTTTTTTPPGAPR
ncbi:type IV secretion protein Rhs [Rhodococcus triatomae]|uniref:Anti-sigma-D factor RsdA to sigma factor binding region n=1 Tax=Rhodococcus triatomae TaxID=300028 RepID=A0A1G8FSG0_9NOCA|nr:anti-sigma-D factor RsdA [Rhodococcus triatomae]QNG19564.1 type IV secretion protein Rhs [Rhodococcus triatomae]QNG24521.1 type IV secretion protein Rhs [Rhodococcus triatomae]SDH85075.1 Anti-sigma-D factor RsdA to sigma factor binding region [Rhodococcus triatomae]